MVMHTEDLVAESRRFIAPILRFTEMVVGLEKTSGRVHSGANANFEKGPMNQASIFRLLCIICAVSVAWPQGTPRTPAQDIRAHFVGLNQKIMAMAKDFPAADYGYRPAEGVRSFGDVIIHIASGNIYAAKAGRGEKVPWDELNPKAYKNKAEIVVTLEKSIQEATAALQATRDERFAATLDPWLDVIEHAGEHCGQLVAYYRAHGLIPPQSRGNAK